MSPRGVEPRSHVPFSPVGYSNPVWLRIRTSRAAPVRAPVRLGRPLCGLWSRDRTSNIGSFRRRSPVRSQFTPSSLPVHSPFAPRSLPVHSQFTPSSLPVHSQFTPSSLPVHTQFIPSSFPVHSQFIPSSFPVHSQFIPSSLGRRLRANFRPPYGDANPKFIHSRRYENCSAERNRPGRDLVSHRV